MNQPCFLILNIQRNSHQAGRQRTAKAPVFFHQQHLGAASGRRYRRHGPRRTSAANKYHFFLSLYKFIL